MPTRSTIRTSEPPKRIWSPTNVRKRPLWVWLLGHLYQSTRRRRRLLRRREKVFQLPKTCTEAPTRSATVIASRARMPLTEWLVRSIKSTSLIRDLIRDADFHAAWARSRGRRRTTETRRSRISTRETRSSTRR